MIFRKYQNCHKSHFRCCICHEMCVCKCECLFHVKSIITRWLEGKYKEDKWTVYYLFYPISAHFFHYKLEPYKKQNKKKLFAFSKTFTGGLLKSRNEMKNVIKGIQSNQSLECNSPPRKSLQPRKTGGKGARWWEVWVAVGDRPKEGDSKRRWGKTKCEKWREWVIAMHEK